MRPLVHPPVDSLTVEAILHALSDPVRAAIFSAIVDSDRSKSCSSLVAAGGPKLAKSSLSQHLKVLREAGLIRGERRGVEVLNTSRCADIETRFPGLIAAIVNAHRIQSAPRAPKPRAAASRRTRPRRP